MPSASWDQEEPEAHSSFLKARIVALVEAGLQICPSGWTALDHKSFGCAQLPASVVPQVVADPRGGTLRDRPRLESDPGFVGIVYLKIVVSQAYFKSLRPDRDNVAAGPAGTTAFKAICFIEHGNPSHLLQVDRAPRVQRVRVIA